MSQLPDYPNPITICSTTGTGVQPGILDIGAFNTPGYPPVLQIYISATATVVINGAVAVTGNPAALVNATDVSGGGFTASDFYDLIPGVRFYQIDIQANTGTVTVTAGVGPQREGYVGLPQLLRMSNNAPQGT